MVKPPDFQSGNCRFESCPDHQFKQTGSSVRQARAAHNREDGRSNRPRSTRYCLGVAQSGESPRPGTERSPVRIRPPRPFSVLGIVAVHPAFNRKRGVRFSQGGPFAAVAQRSRARPCEGRGHKFESCQPRRFQRFPSNIKELTGFDVTK